MTSLPPAADGDTAPPLLERLRQDRPRIPVTVCLIAVNVAVFAAMLSVGAGLWHTSNSVQLAWGANFGPATGEGQWWRLGTAAFLHFGLVHLAMNMWALWDCGQFVERLYGRWRFAVLYAASALLGNLVSLVLHGGQAISGGASGAIFGVIGALLVALWRRRGEVHPAEFRWLFWGATGFAGLTIAMGLMITGIDNAAHIGGLVGGLLVGAGLGDGAMAAPPRVIRLATVGLLVAMLGGLLDHLPAPAYRWSDERRARDEIREFLGEDRQISARWESILREGRRGGLSFEQLAGRIESDVTERYEDSFDQLSALQLNPATPSAGTVDTLRRYAEQRRDASLAFADALRAQDAEQARKALDQARQASRALLQPTPAAAGRAPATSEGVAKGPRSR